jgi:hypothetical protein
MSCESLRATHARLQESGTIIATHAAPRVDEGHGTMLPKSSPSPSISLAIM